jgi:3-oxoacyl-[acyl-carrier protein] reductase
MNFLKEMGDMSKFDFYVGQREEIKHKIIQSDIEKFIALSGDNNPIHSDKEFALETHLKDPVAHGMLGVNFISTVIGNKLPGAGALWLSQTLEFVSPARVGDNLTIEVIVKSIFELEKILNLETLITKNNGEVVTRGTAKVKVLSKKSKEVVVETKNVNKVAIVIGGSGGIGGAISKALAQNNFKVMVSYKSDDHQANRLMQEIKELNGICRTFRSDLSSIEEIETLISETMSLFGSVSHLIICASSPLENKPIKDLSWKNFMMHINVNTRIFFELTQKLVPIFQAHGSGNIIGIGSSVTDNPPANWLPYVTAKSSLLGLMKGLAIELGPMNIRVNLVSPSTVETPLTSNFTERSKLITIKETPLKRLTRPSDIAQTVLFLASENSVHITGQNIKINGGA